MKQSRNLAAKEPRGGQDAGWLVSKDVKVVLGSVWTVDSVIQDLTASDHGHQLKESCRVTCVDRMRLELDGGRKVPTRWGIFS